MSQRKPAKQSLALPGEADPHLAAIALRPAALHQRTLGQPVDQSNHAVVPQLQALRQVANRRLAIRPALDRQQQLVLCRLEPGFACRLFTEAQESPDLIAELGQGLVIGQGQSGNKPLLEIS